MIRKPSNLDIYVMRHGEAYKNLAKVSGGGDQRLTPRGEMQASVLGAFLLQASGGSEYLRIVHQPEGRSEETAKRIGAITLATVYVDPRLKGVGMGDVAGLSQQELEEQYPGVAKGMAAWRASGGKLQRPKVPGSEPMTDFANRVHRGLLENVEFAKNGLAIVGTTSTLVMLRHLLQRDGEFSRPDYEFFEMPLGSIAIWHLSVDRPVEVLPTTVPQANQ